VVADSAQFSAALSELSRLAYVGTALTLQTSFGFLLTLVSIRLVLWIELWVGWSGAFALLALGPLLGILAMVALRLSPAIAHLAGGRGQQPHCALNLGLGWSHARLDAMDGIVLRPTQRFSHSFRLPLTHLAFTVVLLVLCAQVTLSLRAMTIAMPADRQLLPPATAAPPSLFPAETTYDAGAECCTSATSHCIQTCSAVQAPAATVLQTLATVPVWWQLAALWLRTNAVRIPTPPPKA